MTPDPLRIRLIDFLAQIEEYMDDRADADVQGDPPEYVPNREMRLLSEVQALQAALVGTIRVKTL